VTGDTDLKHALAHIVYEQGIIPSTELTVPLAVGQQSITVADTSDFHEDETLVWPDLWLGRLADEPLRIKSADGGQITCDFQGTGYQGFQYAQPVGTWVTKNIQPTGFEAMSKMLVNGDPAVFVIVAQETTVLAAMRMNQAVYDVQIAYWLNLLNPSRRTGLDPNVWSNRQQERAAADVDTIVNALRNEPRVLTSDGQMHAQSLGMPSTTGDRIRKNWRRPPREGEVQRWGCLIETTVQGKQAPFTGV
jgi:hypothetical protein